ncbi:winged helix-turn-helix domain-containing protein [Solicola gregarius]|uniref:Metalloregulator ArsR/SmtB family transcription factor n=1 Tax=Solicola gregarius TaxID=2908642 RepID=A0AA46TLB1_9ACTN|nr:metalloregulator ArsR/SmtB family transcription factor [Solicola gregarius]UYM07360.1 metalloregulator ArsR/SmtB family transcription factor [Solicola gregarius]
MSFDTRQLTTAAELKALAHPLRLAIAERLGIDGPMTASELAEVLDETPANCSWHLRKLAEHGLVEETNEGRGRRRPWRATSVGLTWDEGTDDPNRNAAGRELTEQIIQREVDRFRRNRIVAETDEWRLGAIQNAVWMTEAEASVWHDDLKEVMMRYRGRLTGDADRPDGARLVHMLALASVDREGDR